MAISFDLLLTRFSLLPDFISTLTVGILGRPYNLFEPNSHYLNLSDGVVGVVWGGGGW